MEEKKVHCSIHEFFGSLCHVSLSRSTPGARIICESQESLSNVNLQAGVQDDRQEGDAEHIEEVEDAEQPHCETLSLFLKCSKHVCQHTCES